LPALGSYSAEALARLKADALATLHELVPASSLAGSPDLPIVETPDAVRIGHFAVRRGTKPQKMHGYSIDAPTTRDNAMRVARACQLPKPILLEGSPGVGKTSLVVALAKLCGHHLCRINLSDQTDQSDLFGTDLPVDGGQPGEFAWKDAEFLTAMQCGHWVLLDEMNLAPQAVLEGLNAVLDHRGSVFIPELGREFTKHPAFRIFAAQNPLGQGGGRKGLPKSFVNRFTKVFVEALTPCDLHLITRHTFPGYPEDWLRAMITFNTQLQDAVAVGRMFGRSGSPWEFNLRDLTRWGTVLHARDGGTPLHPAEHLRSIYLARFRTEDDRTAARKLFDTSFGEDTAHLCAAPHYAVTPPAVQVGHFVAPRANFAAHAPVPALLQAHLPWMEAMGVAIQQQWLVIVTGYKNTGKTSLVRLMARLSGVVLHEAAINNATDTTDLLGSFEQVDMQTRYLGIVRSVVDLVDEHLRTEAGSRQQPAESRQLRRLLAGTAALDPASLQVAVLLLDALDGLGADLELKRVNLRADIVAELVTPAADGRFEWVDGPLVRALKDGQWLLLDNANLCSPSVLDRLNALCEPGGVLTLNEQGVVHGAVTVIVPHPGFRLIMCVDPQHGELSRAMRNRGIEIVLTDASTEEDHARMQSAVRVPQGTAMDLYSFEVQRRGLGKASTGQANDSQWPSGLLANDSASSVSKDLGLALLSSPSTPLASLDSLLFTTRSLVPALSANALRLFTAFLPSSEVGVLAAVAIANQNHELWGKIQALCAAFGRIWPVTSAFLSHEVSAHALASCSQLWLCTIRAEIMLLMQCSLSTSSRSS
jgi:midasin